MAAADAFGGTSRLPMLWVYTSNDTFFFFGLEPSKRMYKPFTAAGDKAEYHLLPPFGGGTLYDQFTGCRADGHLWSANF